MACTGLKHTFFPANDASVNLARTMGFISEGSALAYAKINKEWRDHLRFTYIS